MRIGRASRVEIDAGFLQRWVSGPETVVSPKVRQARIDAHARTGGDE
jgi:hypothetical protein